VTKQKPKRRRVLRFLRRHWRLSVLLVCLVSVAGAVAVYARLKRVPAYIRLAQRGNIYLRQGQAEKAIAELQASLKLREWPRARFTLADAYLQSGRFQEALDELGRAADAGYSPGEIAASRARVYVAQALSVLTTEKSGRQLDEQG